MVVAKVYLYVKLMERCTMNVYLTVCRLHNKKLYCYKNIELIQRLDCICNISSVQLLNHV